MYFLFCQLLADSIDSNCITDYSRQAYIGMTIIVSWTHKIY